MRTSVLLTAAVLLLSGCREERHAQPLPGATAPVQAVRQSELQPGVPRRGITVENPYAQNPNALAEGQRLYHWYNCSGCHFAGGGGIGPPLMDSEWIYGSEPQNILDSIFEGRPEGMPSYAGKIPLDHAWKIVAYVQSLGGVPEGRQPGDVGRGQVGDPGQGGAREPTTEQSNEGEEPGGGSGEGGRE